MNFHSALFKPEVFYPVTTSIFAKLSLQPNRLCSIVTVCIFPGYLSKGRYGMHFFKAGNVWVEHTKSLNLEEHCCDALKCSLKICSMVVVIPYFLNINECSNIPVKFSFRVWILRFWKGMPSSVVAGLSICLCLFTVSASNLSIIEHVWKEGMLRLQFLTESLSGNDTEFHFNSDQIRINF